MMTFKQLFFGLLTLCSVTVSASTDSHDTTQTSDSDAPFDPREMIMEHVMDSHSWHIMDWNDYAVSVPLPVILWTEEGLVAFSSSKFHHDTKGHHVVEAGGQRFVNHHEKIYCMTAMRSPRSRSTYPSPKRWPPCFFLQSC